MDFELLKTNIYKMLDKADYESAESSITNELKKDPGNNELTALAGIIELERENTEKAQNYFSRVFYFDHEHKAANAGMLRITALSQTTTDLSGYYKIICDSTSIEGFIARKTYLLYTNDIIGAVNVMKQARSFYPNSVLTSIHLADAMCVNNSDDPQIEEIFDSLYKLSFENKSNPIILKEHIRYCYRAGKYESCHKICNRVMKRFPNLPIMDYVRSMDSKSCEMMEKSQNNDIIDDKKPLAGSSDPHSPNTANDLVRAGKDLTAEQAMAELDRLIGLESVKEQIQRIHKKLIYDKARASMKQLQLNDAEKDSYHFVFSGNPGTGKTTVARLLASIFHSFGLLKTANTVEVDRGDLVGEYQGHTAQKTKKVIDQALGGVLFIDEAYALCNGENDNFGKEAIDAIVKAVEDHRHDFVVILAGYKDEMYQLIKSNVGLESRFTKYIDFPDYSEEELLEIGKLIASDNSYKFSHDGEIAFREKISKRKVNKKFGNAREVRNLMSEAFTEKAVNFDPHNMSLEYMTILTPQDFGIDIRLSPEKKSLMYLEKLNSMIGLSTVKYEVASIMSLVKYYMDEQKLTGTSKTTLPINMHMCFTGNPGTGKTTVARLYSQILAAVGFLKTGEIIEVSRADLVGKYQGHTAEKVKECCERAYGGVLFIDEAYSLVHDQNDTFGYEAVAALIKEMEDNRDRLVVIFAGYSKEMSDFVDTNSGIASRIAKTIEFPDYNESELMEILDLDLSEGGITYGEGAREQAERAIHKLYQSRDKHFGNGRDVRNLYEDVFKNMVKRVQEQNLTGADRKCFMPEDFSNGSNGEEFCIPYMPNEPTASEASFNTRKEPELKTDSIKKESSAAHHREASQPYVQSEETDIRRIGIKPLMLPVDKFLA